MARVLQSLLMMLPALALAIVMLARPYMGARAIVRLRKRRARLAPRSAPARLGSPGWRPQAVSGGRLIAAALAGRAPPAALAGRR
jgi:hypothetical protein